MHSLNDCENVRNVEGVNFKFPKGLNKNYICSNSMDITEISDDNTTLTLIGTPVNISWKQRYQVNVNVAKILDWIEGIVWSDEIINGA